VGGKWRYKTINETPGTMDVNDLVCENSFKDMK